MELRRKACKLRLPDYLRGDVAAWGESVEHGEATDRYYSQDDIRRALAILNLESLPTETRLKRAFRKKAADCHPDKVPPQRRAWEHVSVRQGGHIVDTEDASTLGLVAHHLDISTIGRR